MNGIHDMGGMQGFGVIPYQPHEPVFRARWEGRAAALDRALLAWGAWNFDAFRHQVEQIPPPDYLRMSYWERRLTADIELAVKTGMISREEIAERPAEVWCTSAVAGIDRGRRSQPAYTQHINDPIRTDIASLLSR